MNNDFKKWLCGLAGIEYNLYSGCAYADECFRDECLAYICGAENDGCYIKNITTKILIKAKWKLEDKNPDEEIKKLEQELLEKFNRQDKK